MTDNKRKFARVNYPCSITVWRDEGYTDVIMANTANISAGGICVYLNQILPIEIKIEDKAPCSISQQLAQSLFVKPL